MRSVLSLLMPHNSWRSKATRHSETVLSSKNLFLTSYPLFISGIVVSITVATLISAAAHREPRPPNIVLILADDMGYGDPRCYNPASKIPTPNIDRLAKDGMRFTDAHSPSAVCTPTRYALLTGRYCWRTSLKRGVLQGYDPLLIEPGRITIASVLKERGYATACVGKWHLGFGRDARVDYEKLLSPGPNSVGFDYFYGIPSSLDFPPYVFVENDRPTERPTATIATSESQRTGGGGFWRAGAISPGFRHEDVLPRTTEKAVEFIRKQDDNRPFFLYIPLTAPHTPWMPAAKFRGKSGAGSYGDFVAQTDDSVGEILRALKEKRLDRNTLVILTSDNGAHWLPEDISRYGHKSNLNWRGQKADIHEAGHRVPFITRWPGRIRASTTCDQLAGLVDLFATFADLAGATLPDDAAEDSFSLVPLFKRRNQPVRESLVHHSGDGVFAIRSGEWKLIEGLGSGGFTPPRAPAPQPGGPEGQLYDLTADPGETKNLYLDRPDQVTRLKALLSRIRTIGRTRS